VVKLKYAGVSTRESRSVVNEEGIEVRERENGWDGANGLVVAVSGDLGGEAGERVDVTLACVGLGEEIVEWGGDSPPSLT
jgi:hypothetical protein